MTRRIPERFILKPGKPMKLLKAAHATEAEEAA